MSSAATTTNYTHTSTGNSFHGTATCITCGAGLKNIYTATNNTTGQIEHLGSNCHYRATGIDTRQIDEQNARKTAATKANARTASNAASIPAAELGAIRQAQYVASTIDTTNVNTFTVWFLYEIRDFVVRWSKTTRDFDEWITSTITADNLDPDVADTIREGVTLIDFTQVHGKLMTSRFGGRCGTCDARISKGDDIVYNGSAHCATHAA